MPLGVSSVQWDMRMAWGSKTAWAFNMFKPGGIAPYTLAGHTFEYIVKAAPAGSALIKITSDTGPVPANAGTLTEVVTASLASLILTLYPPATLPLTAPLTAYHALWMDYGDANNARNLFWGNLYLDPSVQP